MNDRPDRKRSAKRVILTILGIWLLLNFLAAACAMIYMNYMLNKINRVDPNAEHTLSPSEAEDYLYDDSELVTIDPDSTQEHIKLDDITFPTSVPESSDPNESSPTHPSHTQPTGTSNPSNSSSSTIYGDHLLNILLVGQDRREGQTRQRSDTMILVTMNKSDSTITLTSFMRDQYVQIPGYKPNKLNAAYVYGGMSLLSKTLEVNFGVQVDGVVEVDFSGFENVIELLGGVDITLTKSEAKYLNDLYEVKLLASPVVVGENHLDAKQALVYVTLREIDSDYSRTNRQRKLVAAVIDAYKNLPLDQMLSLAEEILPMVSTNLSNAQIFGYATEFFPMLASANVQTLRIPVDGTFSSGLVEVRDGFYGWFQYNIDFETNKKVLREIFRLKD